MSYIPEWEDAPIWANWLAMDEDSEWYWYATMPGFRNGNWSTNYDSSSLVMKVKHEDSDEYRALMSLQERP